MPGSSHLHVTPAARASAQRLARLLQRSLNEYSPKSEVATVVDITYHQTQGYIVCAASRGPVMVVGVPYNRVVPGMRIFMRRLTAAGQTSYLYDGLVTPAIALTNSGSVATTSGAGPAATTATSWGSGSYSGSYLTLPNTVPVKGWFWSFFFCVSQLPTPGNVITLLDTPILNGTFNSVTGGIRFLMDYQAHLGVQVYGAGWGSLTAQTVWTSEAYSPHATWWFNYTLGGVGYSIGSIQYSAGNSAINSLGSSMVTGPGTKPVGLFLLADSNGGNAAPAASWLSKIILGANASGSTPLSPTPLVIDPATNDAAAAAQDANIPTGDGSLIQSSNVTYPLAAYLCDDAVAGGATLPDSWANALTLNVPSASGIIRDAGPY